ncbi:2-amino-4-hydroxy-6-hydroxymethyldihydropteridine diphosphokinase [bacterium]|nr:2-amino-4-hydroxy-6-hydroxymethyldihydropteridine diphosphokinase [candidate division CSSED10-310 bacterium]
MTCCYLGIGSNQDDPEARCLEAIDRLNGIAGVRLQQLSPLYLTEPRGVAAQSWFINAVAEVAYDAGPEALLAVCQAVECAMGRERGIPWGPRRIDIDILLFGNLVRTGSDPLIPHPRMHERRFVLQPLVDISPALRHPVLGVTMIELLNHLNDPGVVLPAPLVTMTTGGPVSSPAGDIRQPT